MERTLSNEDFDSAVRSSLDRALQVLGENHLGDAEADARTELKGRTDEIVIQLRKDNTIKQQRQEQTITNALTVVLYAIVHE